MMLDAERLTTCQVCKGNQLLRVSACKLVRCWACLGRGVFYVGGFKPSRSPVSLATRRTLERLGVRA